MLLEIMTDTGLRFFGIIEELVFVPEIGTLIPIFLIPAHFLMLALILIPFQERYCVSADYMLLSVLVHCHPDRVSGPVRALGHPTCCYKSGIRLVRLPLVLPYSSPPMGLSPHIIVDWLLGI